MEEKIEVGDIVTSNTTKHEGEVTKITKDRVEFIIRKDVTLDYTDYDGDIIVTDLVMDSPLSGVTLKKKLLK